MSKNPLNFVQTYFLTKQDLENAKFSSLVLRKVQRVYQVKHTFQISDSLNRYL